jgi:hypothetical protein
VFGEASWGAVTEFRILHRLAQEDIERMAHRPAAHADLADRAPVA